LSQSYGSGAGVGVGGAVGGGVGGGGVGLGVGFGVGGAVPWQSALVMGVWLFVQFSVAPAGHGHEKELVVGVSRRTQPSVMPPKSKEGTMPINSLPLTEMSVTFCHADKAAGRLPVRELKRTAKVSRSTKALAASDTVP
jgi:hypothetical protein